MKRVLSTRKGFARSQGEQQIRFLLKTTFFKQGANNSGRVASLKMFPLSLTLSSLQTSTDTFANNAGPDETASNGPHLQQWICPKSKMEEFIAETQGVKGLSCICTNAYHGIVAELIPPCLTAYFYQRLS